ncbi:MAG: hypothetical protein ACXVB9_11520 [Bdellovibrionota bacterium]
MRFKRCLLLSMVLSLSGCSLRLNDKVTKQETNVNAGTGCLSQAGDVLDRFQKGSLSPSDHDAFYVCTNQALTTFLNNTDGKNKDFYEPSELGNFLTKYFLGGHAIQPALLTESMALKTALVGGSPDHLSRDDIRHIIGVFDNLRGLTSALRPLMPLDAKSFLARGFSGAEFDAAMKTFITAVGTFGENIKGAQSEYAFAHFSTLIRELGIFLYPNGVPADHWTGYMLRLANAAPPAKSILISPPRDSITTADWAKIYRLAPRYFASMLRVQYYMNAPFSTLNGGGLATVERLFRDFVNMFDFVLQQHPGNAISSDEIDDLVLTLYDQKMLPCRPETARQFVKVLFSKVLGAPSGDVKAKFSITADSLTNFKENVGFLLEGLHGTEALFRLKFGDNFANGTLSAPEIAAVPDATLIAATTQRNSISAEAIAGLKRIPLDVHTAFAADTWDVVIPEKGTVEQLSYFHMLKIHSLRSLNRLLINAYGTPGSGGLTSDELNSLVGDFFPLMLDLHIANETMRASIAKRLQEATLFLYASNGKNGLTMNEALEMEALLISTIKRAPVTHELIANACGTTKKDADGNFLVEAGCYRAQLSARAPQVWSYLPGLVRYSDALPAKGKLGLFDTMASFLRSGQNASDDYTLADSQSFTLLPYYVELLFARYDSNGDGRFDNKEAGAAYLVFEPFIAEKADAKGYTAGADHRAIFDFLLAYQVLPTDDKWDYLFRRYISGPKTFSVDRGQVVTIFSKLMSL